MTTRRKPTSSSPKPATPVSPSARVSVRSTFEAWRRRPPEERPPWGLAWFLANEFCERFYSSHGIVPHTIDHDGLGYYGIRLTTLPCAVNGAEMNSLGRLTAGGNVENWRSGGPGDHGLKTIHMCDSGASTDEIVEAAIQSMDIPPIPKHTHVRCRHKRHGASYEVMFKVATILALDRPGIGIANDPDAALWQKVPQNLANDPGIFYFAGPGGRMAVAGDGRVVGSDENLWTSYMRGKSLASLANVIEKAVGPGPSTMMSRHSGRDEALSALTINEG